MPVVGLVLLALAALACRRAAQRADAWASAPSHRLVEAAAAAALLAAGLFVVVRWGPLSGGLHLAAAWAALGGGVLSLWAVKTHVDRRRPAAGALAALFAFVLFGAGYFVWWGAPGLGGQGLSSSSSIAVQLDGLAQRRRQLEDRRDKAIPALEERMRAQADKVRQDLPRASASTRSGLEKELQDIARVMLALDKERAAVGDLLIRVGQEERRLERLRETQEVLGASDESLRARLDEIEREATLRLDRPVDERIGSGALEDDEVRRKVEELRKP